MPRLRRKKARETSFMFLFFEKFGGVFGLRGWVDAVYLRLISHRQFAEKKGPIPVMDWGLVIRATETLFV